MRLKDKITHWTIGRKDGIGTAISDKSHVYFTIGNGRLTETYFPSPDQIVLHSITLFLNGEKSETEFERSVKIPYKNAPIYRILSSVVKKEIFTDPDSDTLILCYRVKNRHNILKIAFPFRFSILEKSENNVLIRMNGIYIFVRLDRKFLIDSYDKFLLLKISDTDFTVFISFGRHRGSGFNKNINVNVSRERFVAEWNNYVESFDMAGKGMLYRRSLITIKSMEDKNHRGAAVASLAIPWGSRAELSEKNGYHLVWVRDLFFSALAMHLAGDTRFANGALNYMLNKLMRPDGSFKQNATVAGEERWHATQMDQVALPVIFSYMLNRYDLVSELEKSVNFILKNGPWSEQERWEEISGFSPYAMSLQWKALEYYADMRKNMGLGYENYKNKAKEFARNIPRFCYTKSGVFYPHQYFVRVSHGNPDKDIISLKGKTFSAREMISADFLYLVFTELYRPESQMIKNSIEVVDRILRVETPKGISFYRYNGDTYGFDGSVPKGRLWVILTAERGIYEMLLGNDVSHFLSSVEHFATSSFMLPEQVFENGLPTESAAPLAWSHAAYIILYELANKRRNLFSPLVHK